MKIKSVPAVCLVAVFAICSVAPLASCKRPLQPGDAGPHKIRVITTLFPLYDMARHIGGDRADVSLLLPPGVEPHSFEPKPTDVVKIGEADVFIYTGKFMEPWAQDIVTRVANKNLIAVDSSRGTKMIDAVFHDADEPSGSPDPHIWLDFDNAKIMAEGIAAALEAKDVSNKDYYEQRAGGYIEMLTALDSSFRTTLASCKSREIIYGGHYAFGYLARRYGLQYKAAQGISPDAEPAARDMADLVKQIKKDGIKYVFYEELTSPKIAETLAGETNAKLMLLNAAHNVTKDELDKGVSFSEILKRDLDNLKTGLECR